MATIILAYDKLQLWKNYLREYPIRHETIINNPDNFILYYQDEYQLLSIGFDFGRYTEKILKNEKTY
jgi:hypothetical protein